MLKLNPFALRLLLRFVVGLMIGYVCFAAYVWWAMHQPPETFGRVMARMPGPVPFLIFPFETAWMHARTGTLHVGDPAPDFSLFKLDKSERVSTLGTKPTATRGFGIRQLHVTAFPAGGSCPQQALRAVSRASCVPGCVHYRSPSERCVADGEQF